jgi:hypothetical protein
MSEVDDLIDVIKSVGNEKVEGRDSGYESNKYRLMLKWNNSIVKETMSKMWKLTHIIQERIMAP